MKRKFGAMALALSMGLSLTNGVLAEEQPFDVVGESSPRTFENKDVTIINDNVTDPDKEDDGDEKDTDQTEGIVSDLFTGNRCKWFGAATIL